MRLYLPTTKSLLCLIYLRTQKKHLPTFLPCKCLLEIRTSGLTPLTKYYWRVKTNNGGHFSDFSDVRTFYVSAVGIDELSTQKKAIVVSPNPGSGIFKFEHLQVGEHLVIYDLSGKVVSKVVSEGTTTLVNMSAMPKGSYLYQTTYNGKPASEGVFVIGE